MIRKTKILSSFLILGVFAFCTSMAHAFNAPGDPRGTEVSQSVVKWEWESVSNSDMYEVVVDGDYVGLTRDPQYFSYNLWAGEHSLTVRAMRSDGTYSERTPTIKIIVSDWFSPSNPGRSFVVGQVNQPAVTVVAEPVVEVQEPVQASASQGGLSAPTDARGTVIASDGVKWEWTAVDGATSYDVTVDGGYAGSTSNTNFESYGLWEGDHSMTVIAANNQGDISERSNTVKIWVSSQLVAQNDPVDVVAPPPQEENIPAPPPPAGNPDAASIESMVDPASYNYDEVYQKAGYDLIFSEKTSSTSTSSAKMKNT